MGQRIFKSSLFNSNLLILARRELGAGIVHLYFSSSWDVCSKDEGLITVHEIMASASIVWTWFVKHRYWVFLLITESEWEEITSICTFICQQRIKLVMRAKANYRGYWTKKGLNEVKPWSMEALPGSQSLGICTHRWGFGWCPQVRSWTVSFSYTSEATFSRPVPDNCGCCGFAFPWS